MKILQQPSFYVDRARRFQVGEKMGGMKDLKSSSI